MSARLILGIISFCIAMTGIFFGNLLTYAMIGEINRKRPNNRQISYFWFGAAKMMNIYDEYRRFYPEGKLGKRRRLAYITMFIGMAVTAGCLFLRFQ